MRVPSVRHIWDLTNPGVFECVENIVFPAMGRGFSHLSLVQFALENIRFKYSIPISSGITRIIPLTINSNQKGMQLTNLADCKIFVDRQFQHHWQEQILLAVFWQLYFYDLYRRRAQDLSCGSLAVEGGAND